MTMYFESPFKINSIGFDTRDNIVVVGEYSIPREATLNGKEIINNLPPDSYGTSYGFWYDSRAIVVAFTIDKNGDIEKLHKVNIGDIKPKEFYIRETVGEMKMTLNRLLPTIQRRHFWQKTERQLSHATMI